MGQGIPTTPIYLSDRSKSEYGYPIRKENINKKIQLKSDEPNILGSAAFLSSVYFLSTQKDQKTYVCRHSIPVFLSYLIH
jgi:hypothetical protein